MPQSGNRIPYDEMRPRVDLIIEELRELTAVLVQLRDHDLGRDIDEVIEVRPRTSGCRTGGPIMVSPPAKPCDRIDRATSLAAALEASEHLAGTVVLGMRQLRRMIDGDTDPGQP